MATSTPSTKSDNPSVRFKAYLGEVVAMEELTLDTPVNFAIAKNAKALEGRMHAEGLQVFLQVEKAVQEIFEKAKRCRSIAILGRRVKPKLHQFRAFSLPELLQQMKTNSPSFPDNPFVWQLIIDKCYQALLDAQFSISKAAAPPRRLQAVELNAIRYVAGFVVRKLIKKYAKDRGGETFRDCLRTMIYDESDLQLAKDIDSDSFEEYTRLWLCKTDRGGLTHVNDASFWLFQEIELVVYSRLKGCYSGEEQSVASIVEFAIKDEDITYIWSLIAASMINERQFQQLLTVIVNEWVILRGHSLRNVFMERYKRLVSDEKRSKKSLRKELKRKEHEDNQED